MTVTDVTIVIGSVGAFLAGPAVIFMRAYRGCHDKYDNIVADLDDLRKSFGLTPYQPKKQDRSSTHEMPLL